MKLRMGLILATMVLGGMVLSGVVLAVNKNGDSNPNILRGTNGTDYIRGKGGADDIGGKKSRDYLWGNKGNDLLHGGDGHDRIHGDKGDNDEVYGDAGNDKLWAEIEHQGSYQAAKVKGGRKPDRLLGGRGNDTIRARDGNRDIIRGGPGYDKAYVDRVDKVNKDVEKEVVPGGGGPKQCNDGKDNDGDGKTDSQDPGCNSPTDDTEQNKPPVANPNSYSTDVETLLEVPAPGVLDNDSDVDGDALTAELVDGPDPLNDLTLNPDGSFTYNPNYDYGAGTDKFTYKATDGGAYSDVVEVTITVGNPNP